MNVTFTTISQIEKYEKQDENKINEGTKKIYIEQEGVVAFKCTRDED